MFEILTEKLSQVFRGLSSRGRLGENNRQDVYLLADYWITERCFVKCRSKRAEQFLGGTIVTPRTRVYPSV